MSEAETPAPPRRRLRPVYLLPLAFFIGIAVLFLVRLESGGDPGAIPSALIGKPAPAFDLPPLAGLSVPGLARADLDGKVTLVNVFASWCVPCRQEHPVLEALAISGKVRIVGINYKDSATNALRFLADLGNPYSAVGVDASGRTGIDWGVYGVPETYLVDASGIIRHKVIGPLTPEIVDTELMPLIAKLEAPAS